MKRIKLSNCNELALVDDEDYESLIGYTWRKNAQGYAVRRKYTKISKGIRHATDIRMHRQIMGEPEGLEVDHKYGDGLNNQKQNLRIATHRQNIFNRRMQSNNKSGFIGVSWSKVMDKWYACIDLGHKRTKSLGYFDDRIEAAKVYNEFASKSRGEFAKLNQL